MSADDLPIPGLIWAYHFPADAAPRPLPAETVTPNELPADGFLWLHVSLTDARLPVYLPNLALLPADGCRALLARDRHLSLSVTPHAIVGVMPDFRRLELDESAIEYDRFRFLATDGLLVTARTHPLRAMAAVRSDIDAGRRFSGPADLFGALSETFELTVGDIVQGYNDEIDTIEEQIFTERRADLRARVGTLRRGLIQVHRTLRTTARLFHRLDAVLPDELGPAARTMFEQHGHHFAALDQDVVSLQERARLLHEEIDTRQQQETNRHLYILSIATSLLLPPTLVTGYFGMNTKDLPLQDIPDGALWATGLMLASAVAAALALWRVGVGRG